MVRVRSLVLAITVASALGSQTALALGLGELKLQSALNQPLQAEIELLDVQGLGMGDIVPSLASAQEFKRLGLDRPYFLSDLKFTQVQKPNGQQVIRVTSSKVVREPYLNLLVEVLWPSGRLLREYTLLVDPPEYSREPVVQNTLQASVGAAVATTSTAVPAVRQAQAPLPTAGVQKSLYRTVPNDRLWDIAERFRQGGSIQQTMLAIRDLNPDAFVNGNINRLKSGQPLRLPTPKQIAQRTLPQAIREVAQQSKGDRGHGARNVRQLDATRQAAGPANPTPRETDGSLSLLAEGNGAAAVGSETGTAGNDVAALQNQLASLKEVLDSTRQDNLELNQRLKDLQSQQEKLARLLQLKDEQLAQLQTQLANPKEPEQLATTTPATPAATEVTAPPVQPQPTPAAQAAEAPAQAETPAPAPVPVKPVVPPPAPLEEESLLDDLLADPIIVGATAGLVLLLALLGVRAARKRSGAPGRSKPVFTTVKDSDAKPVKASEATFAELMAMQAQAEPQKCEADALAAEQGPHDVLAEADTYIAYGRFSYAAELLQEALKHEPERNDLRLKLMEVRAEMGDAESFAQEEKQLHNAQDPQTQAEVAKLHSRFPKMAVTAAVAVPEEPAPVVPVMAEHGQSPVASAPEAAPTLAMPPKDDFDFDFDLPDDTVDTPALSVPPADVALDLSNPTATPPQELADLQANNESGAKPSEAAQPLAPLDFDFDLPKEPEPAKTKDAALTFDLPEDFDLSVDHEPKAVPKTTSLKGVDQDFNFLDDIDETSTKLDLAKAYVEMGDADGARDILDEIIVEGNAAQKQEAREMLAALA